MLKECIRWNLKKLTASKTSKKTHSSSTIGSTQIVLERNSLIASLCLVIVSCGPITFKYVVWVSSLSMVTRSIWPWSRQPEPAPIYSPIIATWVASLSAIVNNCLVAVIGPPPSDRNKSFHRAIDLSIDSLSLFSNWVIVIRAGSEVVELGRT